MSLPNGVTNSRFQIQISIVIILLFRCVGNEQYSATVVSKSRGRVGEPTRPAHAGGAGRDPEYREVSLWGMQSHTTALHQAAHTNISCKCFYFMHFINKLFMPCLVCQSVDLRFCRHTTQYLCHAFTLSCIVNEGRRCNMLHSQP